MIADFANGEISQAASLFDTEITLQQYLDKSFYKVRPHAHTSRGRMN